MPMSAFLQSLVRGVAGLLMAFALAACQTTPAPEATGPFTPEQVAALQRLGFADTGDGWELNLGGRILFASGSGQLSPADRETVRQIATTLQSVGIESLRVEGHTDNTGGESLNVELSLRRAEAVAREMANNGILYENIVQRGMGTERPVADNATEAGRAQNRRTSIIVPAH